MECLAILWYENNNPNMCHVGTNKRILYTIYMHA